MSAERPSRDEKRRSVAPEAKPSGGSYSVAPGASADAPAVEYLSAPRSVRVRVPSEAPPPSSQPRSAVQPQVAVMPQVAVVPQVAAVPQVAVVPQALRAPRVPDLDLESVAPLPRRTSDAPPDMELEGLVERTRLSEPPPLPVVYPSPRPPAVSELSVSASSAPPTVVSERNVPASSTPPVAAVRRALVFSEPPPLSPAMSSRNSVRPPMGRVISALSPGSVDEGNEQPVQAFRPPSGWSLPPALLPQGDVERLCDEVLSKLEGGSLVVAVTSEGAKRELKSNVAAQLAVGVAGARGPRVLLLEGDLSRPRVTRVIGAEMATSTGFSQQMQAKAQAGSSSPWSVLACSRTLHVLGEGRFRSPELLRSAQFEDALAELRQRYDLIVLDGPTSDFASDMRVLRRQADAVVFAVSSAVERESAIEQGTKLFGASLLTIVTSNA